jgi:hypothetical protein
MGKYFLSSSGFTPDLSEFKTDSISSGRKVTGTWGTYNSDPRPVEFSGVKIGNHDAYASMGIQSHWDDHNQAAYDKANRDRWRRR